MHFSRARVRQPWDSTSKGRSSRASRCASAAVERDSTSRRSRAGPSPSSRYGSPMKPLLSSCCQGVYLSDDDPELIEGALAFNIKTIETLLASGPAQEHSPAARRLAPSTERELRPARLSGDPP